MREAKLFVFVLLAVGAVGSFSCSPSVEKQVSPAIEVGVGTHLFVDDYLIQDTEKVWRTLNRPGKHRDNPVMKPDRPWEGNQDLSSVGDREIRLKFILGNAKLYSFKLE